MRRSAAVPLLVAPTLALVLAGCGSTHEEKARYQGVCVDRTTQQRVRDSSCHDTSNAATGWYYYGLGRTVPPVGGAVVTTGTGAARTDVPKGTGVVRGGESAGGGDVTTRSLNRSASSGGRSSVTRGGFGGGDEGSGG